ALPLQELRAAGRATRSASRPRAVPASAPPRAPPVPRVSPPSPSPPTVPKQMSRVCNAFHTKVGDCPLDARATSDALVRISLSDWLLRRLSRFLFEVFHADL